MKFLRKTLACASLCLFVLVVAGPAAAASDLIPPDVVIQEGYQPGVGAAVGEISQVSGKVAVIHINEKQGYWASAGNKLFKGDTLITMADAYAAFKLNDGSFMSLSPDTKLEITKSIYAPEKNSRSTFMSLIIGRTRFVVKKLVDARHSEFKVKTNTSVAGVRGSDFVISAADALTEVTALENTELEVASLAMPEAKPLVLRDFERTRVRKGALPEEARKVSAEEIDRLMKEFRFAPQEGKADMGLKPEAAAAEVSEAMVIKDNDLIKPDFRVSDPIPGLQVRGERMDFERLIRQEKAIEDKRIHILEQQNEKMVKSNLPDFPGTP